MTTRAEHLTWCKKRAHEELNSYTDEVEATQKAWASMVSDLGKHEATANHVAIGLGMLMLVGGQLSTKVLMKEFIDGFC